MKASKEIRRFINRHKKLHDKFMWDCLFLCIKPNTCKKNFKRQKKLTKEEFNSINEV